MIWSLARILFLSSTPLECLLVKTIILTLDTSDKVPLYLSVSRLPLASEVL